MPETIKNTITLKKLQQYFSITKEALEQAKTAFDSSTPSRRKEAEDFYDMASRYFQDAHFFSEEKKDYVLAFAALNYAHGWLDAGARIGLFKVKDSRLFTVDND